MANQRLLICWWAADLELAQLNDGDNTSIASSAQPTN